MDAPTSGRSLGFASFRRARPLQWHRRVRRGMLPPPCGDGMAGSQVFLIPSLSVRSGKDLPGRRSPLAGADENLGDLHGIERRAFPELIAADDEVESHTLGLG